MPDGPQRSLYSLLSSRSSEAEDEEEAELVSDDGSASLPPSARSQPLKTRTPWVASTVFFAVSTASLLLHILFAQPGTFERGFTTDLAGVRSAISTHQVSFTGSPSFTEDGEEYAKPHLGQKQYVGPPNEQMDENWRELTENRYFLLTADEALDAWGPEYVDFWDEDRGGYLAGLDMFHTLHSLDHLRQSFYPERYPQTPIHGTMHRDHCIDHLRQMVMCNADVTPIPTRFFPGIAGNYIDSNRLHTCRDFGAIRKWTTEKFHASKLIEEYH